MQYNRASRIERASERVIESVDSLDGQSPEVVGQWHRARPSAARRWQRLSARARDALYWSSQYLALSASEPRDRQGDPHRLSGVIRCVKEINSSTEENSRNCREERGRPSASQNNTLCRSHRLSLSLSHSWTYLAPVALSDFCSSRNELRREEKTTAAAAAATVRAVGRRRHGRRRERRRRGGTTINQAQAGEERAKDREQRSSLSRVHTRKADVKNST